MIELIVSFKNLNIVVYPDGFKFRNKSRQRLEAITLLAYQRLDPLQKGLVWPTGINQLPAWRKLNRLESIVEDMGATLQQCAATALTSLSARRLGWDPID